MRDELADAEVVVIKSHKSDLYGRYVADVLYSARPHSIDEVLKKGRHLNQRLLVEGLAERA